MRIAVVSTYTHPTRLVRRERSVMQSSVPELIAALCPDHAQVELFNEKERELPPPLGGPSPGADRAGQAPWDLVFFSYLHSYYEHTKVLSARLRRLGIATVAGGRHSSHFPEDCARYFDAVVTGDPEANVPQLVSDFERGALAPRYDRRSNGAAADVIKPYRYDLIDYRTNPFRLPGIEASRGCPFACNFCVLTGWERYRYRPIDAVIDEIRHKMTWNRGLFGLLDDSFIFLDNNLGGSPRYLAALCEALIPLRKIWGCAVTFNVLRDPALVQLMGRAGCRYVYTGLESLDPQSLRAMNKGQNKLGDVDQVVQRCFASGILLSFGLLVGSDGDTNAYLEGLPRYLAELKYFSVTFLGIVCPYPETPFFRQVAGEGRLLPGVTSRDLDGYTLCHRPAQLHPSEVVDHFQRLCKQLGSWGNVARHYSTRLGSSALPGYKAVILGSGLEIASISAPVRNPARRYIAGLDAIEAEDLRQLSAFNLPVQAITAALADGLAPPGDDAAPRRIRTAPSASG